MKIGYSYVPEDEGFVSKATGKELRARSKDCVEICAAIRGMKAKKARAYLQDVLDMKKLIPIKKFKNQAGHKKGMKPYGKSPVKSVAAVLTVLDNAIANAEFRGLNLEDCIVASAVAQRGHKIRRIKPKGRHAVYTRYLVNVQIFLEEASE